MSRSSLIVPQVALPLQRSNTVVRVITEPEPAHVRMGNQALATPTMEKEGIAGADHFFNQTEPKFDAVDVSPDMDVDVEKANQHPRRSR
jgi:hypothetical protein